jgi:hypothetical protein
MQRSGLERLAPLAGVLFVLLTILSFVLPGEPPDVDEGTREVVDYWKDKDTLNMIAALAASLAAFTLIWFGSSLRGAIARVEGGTRRLANLAFAGTIVAGTGIAIDASLRFIIAEAVDELPGESVRTLAAMWESFFWPMVVGMALVLASTGVAAVRTGFLPRWLGWILSVAWIPLFTPVGFVIFILGGIWIGVMGVVLFRREGAEPPPDTGSPPAAAPMG